MEGEPVLEAVQEYAGPIATTAGNAGGSGSPVLLDTVFLLFVRLVLGFICRRLLSSAINPTLRELSKDENALPLTARNPSSPRLVRTASEVDLLSELETDDDFSRATPSSFPSTPVRKASSLPLEDLDSQAPTPKKKRDEGNVIELSDLDDRLTGVREGIERGAKKLELNHGRTRSLSGTTSVKRGTRGLGRLARMLFCVCFAEACTLIILVLCHAVGLLHSRSRQINFSFSLHFILALILLLLPLVQCLLLTYRSSDSTSNPSRISFRSRVLVALIPFALYFFLFSLIPPYLNAVPTELPEPLPMPDPDLPMDESPIEVVAGEDWEGQGWLASTMGRVVVLGIVTLGGLSGFGAMRTAWNFFEHVRLRRSQALTENDVARAEQSLYRVRQELVIKKDEVDRPRPSTPTGAAPSSGWMSKVFSGKDEQAGARAELEGLEAMERQMARSLRVMQRRKQKQEFSRTFFGQLYNLLGYGFAIYCAARLLMCLPSIIFPPVSHHSDDDTPGPEAHHHANSNGDWISYLLVLALSHLPIGEVDINVALWSRTISLLLTGLLIMSSLAQILRSVSKIIRLTSKAAGASFLLLSLGQLFSVYVISLLIQLRASLPPPPPSETGVDGVVEVPVNQTESLLSTLPDFRTFGRLFDIVFLLVALGTATYRFIALKISDV